MNTFFKKHSRFLTALLLNLLALGLIGWLLWLRSDLGEKIRLLVAEQITLKERQQQLEQLRALVEKTAPDRQELERRFVNPDSLPNFIEQIESLGTKNGIESHLTTVEAVPTPTAKLKFSLRLAGPRAKVLQFIKDLEQLPYRLQFVSGNLETEGASDAWSGSFNVELLSYQAEAKVIENNKDHD